MTKCEKCGKKLNWFSSGEIEGKKVCYKCLNELEEKQRIVEEKREFKEQQKEELEELKNIKKKETTYSAFEFDDDKKIKTQYVKIKNPIILGIQIAIGFVIIFILVAIILKLGFLGMVSEIISNLSKL